MKNKYLNNIKNGFQTKPWKLILVYMIAIISERVCIRFQKQIAPWGIQKQRI